jgi:serine/threonine protein phosphatase PrpC
MGQACSTKEGDKPNLDQFAREDEAGKRRLSVITLAGSKQSDEKLPPTTTKKFARPWGESHVMDVFCMSCAGTYAPESYKENQDDYFAIDNFGKNNAHTVFCVMDGHGVAGRQASNFVKTHLSSMLSKDERLESDPRAVLKQAFFKVHRELQNSRVDCTCSGTTCVLALCTSTKILCANSGDSRCVLGYKDASGKIKHKNLSNDHKPELPGEKMRIEGSGGRVEPMKDSRHEPIGPPRVWVAREMYPGLAMSRSIGDSIAQSVGVTCEPEFIEHTLDINQDCCMILASDGVWEFIDSPEAIEIVTSASNAEEAANMLCRESLRRWAEEEEVCDDITAIVIMFGQKGELDVTIEAAEAPASSDAALPNQ